MIYDGRRKQIHMSTLVVVGFDEPYKAEEVRLKLEKMQSEYLLDLEDAVVAVKDEKGKVKIKLHQAVSQAADGAVSGGFCGSLTGLIFQNAAAGAAFGTVTNGINDHFMRIGCDADSHSSALFVWSEGYAGKGSGRAKGTGGRILQTSLSHEEEAKTSSASAEKSRIADRSSDHLSIPRACAS
jgi:uncharacterized membrane protein